jgi:hypothetical protein
MARTPTEYALHLHLLGGSIPTVRLRTSKEVNDLIQQIFFVQGAEHSDVLHIPLPEEGEYLIVRTRNIQAVHVEPLFASSLEHY